MKQIFTAIFLFIVASLASLDISNETGLFIFDSEIVEFLNTMDYGTPYRFSNKEFNLIENFRMTQTYSDLLSFDLGYQQDPILTNRFYTYLVFHFGFLSMRAGPYFGIFNTAQKPLNPGISLNLGANISNFVFGSFTLESSFGSRLAEIGDYTQDAMEITLGFRLPFVIPIFTVNTAAYNECIDQGAFMSVSRDRYQFSIENERLTHIYRVCGLVGYQELTWSARAGTRGAKYQLNTIYAGLELAFQTIPTLLLYIKTELPLYTWVPTPITQEPPGNALYYQIILGMTWTVYPKPRSGAL